MLNIIISYITGVITGLDNSSLNIYELIEWFDTYNKVANVIEFVMTAIAVIIPFIIAYKITYMVADSILNEKTQD